ncbi:MAG: hypothetical protein K6G52_07055 [Treponemataceae bacterium]|nr:hypothetical protein [Treponemataceae bacterium]
MKKRAAIFILPILFLFSSPCFARMWTGLYMGLVPQLYTGASYIASNDAYNAVYQDLISTDSPTYSYSAVGFTTGGFFEYDFLENLGVRFDFSIKFAQGFKSVISSEYIDIYYYRTFTSYELAPYIKYYPYQNDVIFVGLMAGPKFALTADKSIDGWYKSSKTSTRIQKLFLPGVSAGTDFGLCVMNNLFLDFAFLFEADFVKPYDSEKTSEWFAQIVGNRMDFSINIGLILKI